LAAGNSLRLVFSIALAAGQMAKAAATLSGSRVDLAYLISFAKLILAG
jgi:hypothetical protein